jgi:hypothetical protein
VKFTRTELIARIEAEIARREAAAADRTAKNRADHERAVAEHVQRTGDAWREFAKAIGRAARAGRPVCAADVPPELNSGGRGYLHVWDRQPPAAAAANVAAHRTLLELVKSCTDDEISVAALQRLGFKTAELFRA